MADPVEVEQFFVAEFIAAGFGLPLVQENEGPAAGIARPYCELKAFPNEETPETLACSNQLTGVHQFSLTYDPEVGAMQGKLKRQEIFNHFRTRRRFTYNGIVIDITANMPFIADKRDDRFVVIGRILYKAQYAV